MVTIAQSARVQYIYACSMLALCGGAALGSSDASGSSEAPADIWGTVIRTQGDYCGAPRRE